MAGSRAGAAALGLAPGGDAAALELGLVGSGGNEGGEGEDGGRQ